MSWVGFGDVSTKNVFFYFKQLHFSIQKPASRMPGGELEPPQGENVTDLFKNKVKQLM